MFKIIKILLIIVLISGCGFTGNKEIETVSPTYEQISTYKKLMHLNDSVKLDALGFKLEKGIDPLIWFKFKTAKQPLDKVFDKKIVDISKFRKNFKFIYTKTPIWFDVINKNLIGNQFELPNQRFMDVGIYEDKDFLTIYIIWFKT